MQIGTVGLSYQFSGIKKGLPVLPSGVFADTEKGE
jgi:hypothetical protein